MICQSMGLPGATGYGGGAGGGGGDGDGGTGGAGGADMDEQMHWNQEEQLLMLAA